MGIILHKGKEEGNYNRGDKNNCTGGGKSRLECQGLEGDEWEDGLRTL